MLDNRLTYIGKYVAYDREDITVDNTVGGVGLTSSKLETIPRPIRLIITVESAQIRYTYDGTAPTSTLGHLVNAQDVLIVEGLSNMKNFKAIRTTANNGKLVVTYER